MSRLRRDPDRIAVAVLILLPFVLLAPALLPGRVLSPLDNLFVLAPWQAIGPAAVAPDPALTDVTQVFHPWTLYGAREIAAGRFPFWNPYSYTGAPFLSNPQTATLFPLTWLAWALPPALALTLPSLLKLAAAGLAMYWLLRVLAVTPIPAFIGAAGYMLSSTLIGWLPWTFATTMVFLPLLFALVERLARRGQPRDVALLALAVGLDVLAGYPQATMHALLATAAWTLTRAPWRTGAVGFLLRVGAAVALGAALAAAQILPAVDYVVESAVYAYRSQWTPPLAVPPRTLITMLMPYFFGSGPATWSTFQFAIVSLYVGLVPCVALPLAGLAWRRSSTRFFLALAGAVAAVHYGAPVASLMAQAPGMALGNNLRLMPLLVFALCALGALGLDVAARGAGRGAARPAMVVRGWFVALVVIAVGAVALAASVPRAAGVQPALVVQLLAALGGLTATAILLLAWLRDARARWGVALAAVQIASLAPLAATYQPVRETRWLYPTPPALAWLATRMKDHRVVKPDPAGFLYGLREAHGYDGLAPRRVEQLLGPVGTGNAMLAGYLENTVALHGAEPLAPATVLFSPARDLAAVRFIVLAPGAMPPGPGLRLVYDAADARIYENQAALPRAFIARRARCVDDRVALQLLARRAIDPAAEVLLAECQAPPPGTEPARAVAARIEVDMPDRVVVSATADAPAWLVLSDTWFPGWRARIDGVETPVLRAHHAFRAVALPPGRHDVEFTFRPRGLVAGVTITLLAGASVVALLLRRRRALAVAAWAVVSIVAGAPPAGAALAKPPFELSVAPTRTAVGATVTVTAAPRGGAGTWDLYVVWLYSERAAFLAPDGTWQPRPVPFGARVAAGQTVSGAWRDAGPAGPATLALLAVEPGADPLLRLNWRFRPSLAALDLVDPRPASPPSVPGGPLVALALVGVVGIVVVLRWPSSPPASLV